MAEIEFPKRPPTPRELDRRPHADDYRPRASRLGAIPGEAAERAAPTDDHRPSVSRLIPPEEPEPAAPSVFQPAGGTEFQVADDNEDAMNTGTRVNLLKLQEQLDRKPLDEIASLLRTLTYGEMIELTEAMWKVQPEESAITQDNLPALLHRWSMSRRPST